MASVATSRRLLELAAVLVVLGVVCCTQTAAQPAASPAPRGTRYTVGGADGWRVPPPGDKERYYADWAANITFYVDDSIEFVYRNDSVIRVGKAGYYHCNETVPGAAPRDGTTLFILDAAGPAYFASADLGHCGMGERLMIDVLDAAAAGQPPAPSPWSPTPGPWSAPSPTPAPAPSTAGPAPVHAADMVVAVALALVAGFV